MKGEMNTTRKNFIYQFVVLTILSVITVTKAEVDCIKRPPFVNPKDCCQIPDIISDEVKEACKEFMKPARGPLGDMNEENETAEPSRGYRRGLPHGPHNHCFFSCVINETGILIDDEIQKETLESILVNSINDPAIVEVVNSNFIMCFEKFKKLRENFEKNPPPFRRGLPNQACTPHNGMLLKCALVKTFKECPESVWANTEECNAARDYFTECKPGRLENGKNEEETE